MTDSEHSKSTNHKKRNGKKFVVVKKEEAGKEQEKSILCEVSGSEETFKTTQTGSLDISLDKQEKEQSRVSLSNSDLESNKTKEKVAESEEKAQIVDKEEKIIKEKDSTGTKKEPADLHEEKVVIKETTQESKEVSTPAETERSEEKKGEFDKRKGEEKHVEDDKKEQEMLCPVEHEQNSANEKEQSEENVKKEKHEENFKKEKHEENDNNFVINCGSIIEDSENKECSKDSLKQQKNIKKEEPEMNKNEMKKDEEEISNQTKEQAKSEEREDETAQSKDTSEEQIKEHKKEQEELNEKEPTTVVCLDPLAGPCVSENVQTSNVFQETTPIAQPQELKPLTVPAFTDEPVENSEENANVAKPLAAPVFTDKPVEESTASERNKKNIPNPLQPLNVPIFHTEENNEKKNSSEATTENAVPLENKGEADSTEKNTVPPETAHMQEKNKEEKKKAEDESIKGMVGAGVYAETSDSEKATKEKNAEIKEQEPTSTPAEVIKEKEELPVNKKEPAKAQKSQTELSSALEQNFTTEQNSTESSTTWVPKHVQIDETRNEEINLPNAFVPTPLYTLPEGELKRLRTQNAIRAEGFFCKQRDWFFCFWVEKYFVLLHTGELVYFEKSGTGEPSGHWKVTEAAAFNSFFYAGWSHPYRFTCSVNGETLYFSFETEPEKDYWLNVIKDTSR